MIFSPYPFYSYLFSQGHAHYIYPGHLAQAYKRQASAAQYRGHFGVAAEWSLKLLCVFCGFSEAECNVFSMSHQPNMFTSDAPDSVQFHFQRCNSNTQQLKSICPE